MEKMRHFLKKCGICVIGILVNHKYTLFIRVESQLCRTNNSMEGRHCAFNNSLFRAYHPPLSVLIKEDTHWRLIVEDFNNNPVNGIRRKIWGAASKIEYSFNL